MALWVKALVFNSWAYMVQEFGNHQVLGSPHEYHVCPWMSVCIIYIYMNTCTQIDKCNKINWFLTIKNICCIKAEVLCRLLENVKPKEKWKPRLPIRKLAPEMGNQNVPELINLHICPLIKSVSTLSSLQEAPAPCPQVPTISWQNYGVPQLHDHF